MEVVSVVRATKIKEIGNGQGRNSRVYLAYDPQLDGNVALKEIPVYYFRCPKEYFKEAQILYANNHPRVVPVQYACHDPFFVRIIMPYFANGSMQDRLNQGPLTLRKTIRWAQEFLTGLHHVHSKGFVHFDIKPSNILIHNDGSVMLSDFGQTMPTDQFGVAKLPPLYLTHLPPEAYGYSKATKQADMYQVGLTLYRMSNGEDFLKPQLSIDQSEMISRIISAKFPRRDLFLPHVPRKLKTIIRKLLELNPSKRYQTPIELMNALGTIKGELLDWQYLNLGNGAVWGKSTISHTYRIKMVYNSAGRGWIIEGHTINKAKGETRRRNAWCGGPFKTKAEAELCVARIFRGMEAGS